MPLDSTRVECDAWVLIWFYMHSVTAALASHGHATGRYRNPVGPSFIPLNNWPWHWGCRVALTSSPWFYSKAQWLNHYWSYDNINSWHVEYVDTLQVELWREDRFGPEACPGACACTGRKRCRLCLASFGLTQSAWKMGLGWVWTPGKNKAK